jgi:putative ABC transport system permease protein
MRDDVRYALRQLRHQPTFALLAVATLAIGIGAAAAMFGLIQGVLLSPPPFTEPDRLVLVSPARTDGQPFDGGATVGQVLAWRGARSLQRPALYGWTFNFLVRGDGSRSMGGMVVTRDFFDVLGVRPLLGRTFAENEASRPGVAGKPGAPPTAILLGYDLWQREFGGDRAIVGKTLTISRMPAPLPVIGVMPAGLPVRGVLNADGERLLVPLFGAVGLLFLIACANVAGLLLARGLQRQQEYATRAAMGAGRARLFRLVLVEAIALAMTAAILGAGLAWAIVAVLRAIGGQAVPRADAVAVGWPVLLFGAAAALVAGVVAGLLPAARASSRDRVTLLKGTRTTAGRVERRLLAGVAVVQVVLTVALLAGAALLVRTAQKLDDVRPGYDTEHVLAMTVTHVGDREQYRAFHEQGLERVAAIPGVRHAAFAWGVPLTGNSWPAEIEVVGRASGSSAIVDRISLPVRSVSEDYFAVMGMRLVDGRLFLRSDNRDAPPVGIVNERFVRRYLGSSPPIGQQIRFPGNDKPQTIVGVIADTRTERLRESPEPELYQPFWQSGAFSKHLVLRTAGDPLAVASQVRDALRAIQPTAAIEKVTTMAEIRRRSTAAQTFALRLLAGFALAATLLAAVGLYGVLSLSVGARTKEMAVRQAIGARRHQVVGLVLVEGGKLVAIGVACGIAGAILVGRLLDTLLFGVGAADPPSLAAAALAFGAVAAVACVVPAWRASRGDVSAALRQD